MWRNIDHLTIFFFLFSKLRSANFFSSLSWISVYKQKWLTTFSWLYVCSFSDSFHLWLYKIWAWSLCYLIDPCYLSILCMCSDCSVMSTLLLSMDSLLQPKLPLSWTSNKRLTGMGYHFYSILLHSSLLSQFLVMPPLLSTSYLSLFPVCRSISVCFFF